MTQKIIIDTDPGIDDAMAILFAFQSPDIEVVGLTTIFGNVHTSLATKNALRLVEFAGWPDVPVAHGAESPLVIPLDGVADFVHAADGLGNINMPPPAGRPIEQPAAQFIVDTVMAHPGQITLVPLGPLTNIALALALEPRIVQNVAGVVLMGGAATVPGNASPAAEANIINDPHAADVVFSAGWPLTMVGLDVTMQVQMTQDYVASLSGSRSGDFIGRICRFYQDFHQESYGSRELHTHDPSAIACVIDPTLFTTVRGPVRVVTDGIAAGQTILDQQGRWWSDNPWSGVPPTDVCLGVDSARLLALYKERISN